MQQEGNKEWRKNAADIKEKMLNGRGELTALMWIWGEFKHLEPSNHRAWVV